MVNSVLIDGRVKIKIFEPTVKDAPDEPSRMQSRDCATDIVSVDQPNQLLNAFMHPLSQLTIRVESSPYTRGNCRESIPGRCLSL